MARSILQARKGMCLDIAEQLESHFHLQPLAQWTADEAAELIDSRLPDTWDEAELRAKEIDNQLASLRPEPRGPGLGDRLRAALKMHSGAPLKDTLEAAIQTATILPDLLAALRKILAHECQQTPCMECADVARAAITLTGTRP